MFQLQAVDPRVFGQRVIEARRARGATQEEVAGYLGCSRPTYIAIEKGDRPAKAEEIIRLAAYFGRSVHELVRPGEPVVGLQAHLRAVVERSQENEKQEILAAVEELQRLAEDYRLLEQMTGAPLRASSPPELTLSGRVDVASMAESAALQERRRLGLGDQPVINLRSTLEWDVGLRIFYWPLPSAIAGMYAYSADVGCCVMVNRKHPAERRRMTMVHEYGHLIVDRYKPGVDFLSPGSRKPANERFAEAFALNFLMPAGSVRQRFNDIVSTTGDFQVADLRRMSHFYFVSLEAMTLRLEQLNLVREGTWVMIKEAGFSPAKAAEILGLAAHPESDDPYPERYKYLAVRAFEQEKISQGQLARFLRCDPVSAREVVRQCLTSPVLGQDGGQDVVQLEFQRSLLPDAS